MNTMLTFSLSYSPALVTERGCPTAFAWKTKIEETDPEKTFAVGLICGPSGCGKSSLVKAGLLPRLSDDVIAVYLEATAEETETRLLNGLRKCCPALLANLGLKETLTALRRGQGIPAGKKVLIVLDQFEQWLHARKERENPELVQALRQCDGSRVQCLVMVRDDFWMAVIRFMRELEIRLLEGQNSAAVDLFDLDHARKVLAAFGRAFGKLPENTQTKEQKDFLNQAVSDLAQEGKIVCVRLALFADMMKGKPWTPATLKEVGGTEGIGVTFLEETFSAAAAPPEHRYHQKAAQGVLKALLPDAGTDIKGHLRSQQELREASGYTNRPRDFDELLHILDNEIRLLTPTDPEGKLEGSVSSLPPGAKYYQLTHDYLVPSLRNWLNRKHKETRRGRAALLLADRAAVWNARPENRQLPSLLQWFQIRWLTQKKNWTPPQRKLMRKATRYHAMRGLVLAVVLVVLSATGRMVRSQIVEQSNAHHAAGLVERLLDAETPQVPGIVVEMVGYRNWTDSLLRAEYQKAKPNSRPQLHASLALLPVDAMHVEYLYRRLLDAEPHEVPVIRDALAVHTSDLAHRLWAVVERPEKGKEQQRLRAAAALVKYDPDSQRWAKVQEAVANDLVRVPAVYLAAWLESFRPVRAKLRAPLAAIFREAGRRDAERSLATDILANYAADRPTVLVDLLMDADEKQFAVLFPKLKEGGDRASSLLNEELNKALRPTWNDARLDPSWKKPDAALREKIEAAHGLLHGRFAMCQTMPLADFLTVAEGLRLSGYRPTRFRPYAVGNAVQAGVVWIRDGQPWRLAHGLSAEALRKQDEAYRKEGFLPGDVSSYFGASTENYAAVWVPAPVPGSLARLEIWLTDTALETEAETLSKQGYQLALVSSLAGVDGKTRHTAIWTKAPGQTAPSNISSLDESFTGLEPDYSGENHMGDLQVDVQVSRAGPVPTTKERYAQQLTDVERDLQTKPADAYLRLQRGLAYLHLGELDKAVRDLSLFIEKSPQVATGYQFRAIAFAHQGKKKEAEADLAKFQELSTDPSSKVYLDAVVSACLGEDREAMKRLETILAKQPKKADLLVQAARAHAVASQAVSGKDTAKAKVYADRAVALLKKAIANGSLNYAQLQTDSDFDPIRQDKNFLVLMEQAKVDRQYAAVWHPSPRFTSSEVHGLAPVEHLAWCRQLMADNYRPVSVSVTETRIGEALVTASVWQRPLVPDEEKEQLAKRQATAAVALLRMGQGEKVWPLLKHPLAPATDPRVRSYLIHRLSPMGADPHTILTHLGEEKEVSIRRALLLSLGEFSSGQLSLAEREEVLPKLLDWYRQDPDPGLHAAVEWLLRQWKQEQRLKQMNEGWSKDTQQRQQTLERIQQELTRNKDKALPHWYVNGEGQTMVVIPGPIEFLMGSPGSEIGREGGPEGRKEAQHRKRIGRSYAIAAKEVTVAQFLRFRSDHDYVRQYTRTPDCPITVVTWYDAAAYCNWLSKQEGIPSDQWCYLPDRAGAYQQGMRLAPNYLQVEGYRLPSEAEWEYACRSGALTTWYYGETEELLGKYAWYTTNSLNRWLLPAGSLKPNDLGLFDMFGNVTEWCQDHAPSYYTLPRGGKVSSDVEDMRDIRDTGGRKVRGGSFIDPALAVSSAHRNNFFSASRGANTGFRPARTISPE